MKIAYNGTTYEFDETDITLGDAEDFEDANAPLLFSDLRGMRQIRAFVWIAIHRTNPDITFDELRGLDFSSLADEGEAESPLDETATP